MSESRIDSINPVLTAGQALQLIADAGAVLSSSLDYAQTLRQVAGLAVPALADWCGVFVRGEDGAETEMTSGYADPELDAVLKEIRSRRRDSADASESRRVAQTGEPILAPDVRTEHGEDLDEREQQLVSRLQPRSYMIVPLLARGRSVGSLTLLSTREGRHYGEADLSFAQTLAARCAVAIDNARLHEAAERSLSLLDTIFATAPVGLAFVDRELRFVRVNATMAAFIDGELLGRSVPELLQERSPELVGLYREVLATGSSIHDHEFGAALSADPADARHWSVSLTPTRDADGEVLGVSAAVLDVTERHRLLAVERQARARADFLAEAGALLEESLEYEPTLRAVAGIAVPAVADWCAVTILDDRGALRQVAVAHADAERRRLGEELNRRFPPDPGSDGGTVGVARTGRTTFVPEVTDAMLANGIDDPEQLALVRRLGLRSVIVVALRTRGRTLGTLTLAHAESGRRFEPTDVQFAEDLARRAAAAIENARLYTERSFIAHTLQSKLLPARLPDIPGVRLAARYRAAGELNEVGGDFYDVFPRSPDTWAMVVGDVSGKGAEAAAVTALARYTLRAGALEDDRPAKALRRLNAALIAHDDTSQFVTAVVAHVSAVTGDSIKVLLSLAGHPPALVVRRDGAVEPTGAYGTILGIDDDPPLLETELVLERGDVLLLYTDGVTEAGPRTRPFGDHGLLDLLPTLAGRTPDELVDAVEAAVVAAHEGRARDDVALLAVGLAR